MKWSDDAKRILSFEREERQKMVERQAEAQAKSDGADRVYPTHVRWVKEVLK